MNPIFAIFLILILCGVIGFGIYKIFFTNSTNKTAPDVERDPEIDNALDVPVADVSRTKDGPVKVHHFPKTVNVIQDTPLSEITPNTAVSQGANSATTVLSPVSTKTKTQKKPSTDDPKSKVEASKASSATTPQLTWEQFAQKKKHLTVEDIQKITNKLQELIQGIDDNNESKPYMKIFYGGLDYFCTSYNKILDIASTDLSINLIGTSLHTYSDGKSIVTVNLCGLKGESLDSLADFIRSICNKAYKNILCKTVNEYLWTKTFSRSNKLMKADLSLSKDKAVDKSVKLLETEITKLNPIILEVLGPEIQWQIADEHQTQI